MWDSGSNFWPSAVHQPSCKERMNLTKRTIRMALATGKLMSVFVNNKMPVSTPNPKPEALKGLSPAPVCRAEACMESRNFYNQLLPWRFACLIHRWRSGCGFSFRQPAPWPSEEALNNPTTPPLRASSTNPCSYPEGVKVCEFTIMSSPKNTSVTGFRV